MMNRLPALLAEPWVGNGEGISRRSGGRYQVSFGGRVGRGRSRPGRRRRGFPPGGESFLEFLAGIRNPHSHYLAGELEWRNCKAREPFLPPPSTGSGMPGPPLEVNAANAAYVDALYLEFLRDPQAIPEVWRAYFLELDGQEFGFPRTGPSFPNPGLFNPVGSLPDAAVNLHVARLQERADQLVRNYRVRGHMIAKVDPLGIPRAPLPELDPRTYGFSEADLDQPVSTSWFQHAQVQTVRGLIETMRATYCRSIGVQFMHIDDLLVREWLQARMERTQNRLDLTRAEQRRILTRLTDAVIFEEFVRKKYVGAKSFSLEGSESLIPLLDLAIETAAEQGIREIVLGMAHRGRLNVLANILHKSPQDIFREFEDLDSHRYRGGGDVKYHLGHSNNWKTSHGKNVHLSLCFNPSHLEYVNPVALGRMRAKQDRIEDFGRERGMVLLIHGDAAFIGEGVTQETLNLSQLPGYTVGGTLHVVVNNQIGFTTSPGEGRSSTYATDVAKMLQIPIFHVNGEDPEAVAQVVRLALDFRANFRRDVVIDMYSYRRWGHNEGDEPSFTQPLLYQAILRRKSVREGYLDHLLKLGGLTAAEAEQIASERHQHLEQGFNAARENDYVHKVNSMQAAWEGYYGGPEREDDDPETGLPREMARQILRKLGEVPEDFHLHKKLKRFLEARLAMAEGEKPLDWASGEALAMGSLALEGYRVRLTGQDSQRGTFSQRHTVLHDVKNGATYDSLNFVGEGQAKVEIHNSPLSENGVLGFEYGYSLDFPEGLVMWEAQFGDFVNAAQVILDQFISSAEDKWRRLSSMVLMLPHGFEGQGPEHSSARPERFLEMAAEDNLQIAIPTTPSQFFHLLRRQVIRKWRKPLIVFTPKSLLRHPQCVSNLDEFLTGKFERVLPDSIANSACRRVLMCSGKVYYDLLAEREKREIDDIAIIRLEQLYPLPANLLQEVLSAYAADTPLCWVQEEPLNMGAWRYLLASLGHRPFGRYPLRSIARAPSASPATGSPGAHRLEQQEILELAFANETEVSTPQTAEDVHA